MIKWLQAVIDLPAPEFAVAADFWTEVTGSRQGEIAPDHPEFVHLLPLSGDMHLELQRVEDGLARVHLDLVVNDVGAMVERAVAAGASLIAQPGHAVLETPGGVPFCLVPLSAVSSGSPLVQAPVIDPAFPHAADQICLDVPFEHFDTDVAFWAELTGWDVNPAQLPEFRSLTQPAELPLRILLQRLGSEDDGVGRAHLDLSSGEHVAVLTERHRAMGATVGERGQRWTTFADPAGMPYCLTSRPPRAGSSQV